MQTDFEKYSVSHGASKCATIYSKALLSIDPTIFDKTALSPISDLVIKLNAIALKCHSGANAPGYNKFIEFLTALKSSGGYELTLTGLKISKIKRAKKAPGSKGKGGATTSGTTSVPSAKSYNGPLNLILYGPPGTGKTYNSINYAVAIIENKDIAVIEGEKREDIRKRYQNYIGRGQIVFTTFHQSMSYEDFIEGIKPEFVPTSKTLSYPVKPGIFKKLVDEIKKSPTPSGALAPIAAAGQQQPQNDGDNREGDGDPRYVIIIDEINRGNVSQIFGELITLIEEDKREGNLEAMSATLPYSGEQFSVPNNLYILGTMNTADRSVEALDTALRRRFSFKEMMPKKDKITVFTDPTSGVIYNLPDILDKINQRIAYLKDREHQIGHSYFMGCDSEEKLKNVFKDKIVPLLQEYFYGNVEYIGLTLGSAFVKEINEVSFPTLKNVDVPAEPAASYRVLDEAEWKALNVEDAIKNLMEK